MDVKIGWMSMGYGTLYPYYMRHEKLIEEPAEGAAPFSQNAMYGGAAVWDNYLGGYNQSSLTIQLVVPLNP